MIPDEDMDSCILLAMMHDLQKDSDYDITSSYISNRFYECLRLLAKTNNQNYIQYANTIKDNYENFPEAYWVKLADIKYNLLQIDTLTNELKEKYMIVLSYLL